MFSRLVILFSFFFFFNDTATTEIYTLSLHDALPILGAMPPQGSPTPGQAELTRFRSALIASLDGAAAKTNNPGRRSEEHTSELQSQSNLVCRLLLEKKKKKQNQHH